MVIDIGSAANPRLRLVRKLASRKGRTAEGKFVAEGINLVREIVDRGLDVDFIMFSSDDPAGSLPFQGRLPDDLTLCRVPERIFSTLTDAGPGVGVIAVADIPQREIGMIGSLGSDEGVLILDRLQDPGNAGTIIRTAAAAGYGMIIASRGTVDIYSPKVLRATAGMIFEVPALYADPEDILKAVRESGRRLIVTDPSGGVPYYDADLRSNVALVIGNEGNGISDEFMTCADVRVTLPMKGRIESLNAAVSAAVLMYEAVRQ